MCFLLLVLFVLKENTVLISLSEGFSEKLLKVRKLSLVELFVGLLEKAGRQRTGQLKWDDKAKTKMKTACGLESQSEI